MPQSVPTLIGLGQEATEGLYVHERLPGAQKELLWALYGNAVMPEFKHWD